VADGVRVGFVIDEVNFPIEAGKVREFTCAVGDGDGGQHAVPLTFATVAGHWRDQGAMVELLGLDLPRIVVGGSEWEYHAPVSIGDRLRGRRVVKAVAERQGARGPMTIITLETRLHRGDGQLSIVQRDTVIEMAG
jgi:hydroxyacyl-ACP dehydratase HTD2-like protein with hotdog domain